jgi:prepilin-type N-terminal cleavage/methylation domain-containing protein
MKIIINRHGILGFSLIEMAIVLSIVGLLLVGLIPTISVQIEQQRRTETRKYMNEVNDALIGFAVANKRLPCPDTNSDGSENSPCTTNASQFGTLPYKDLGVTNSAPNGSELRYAVTKAFADSAVLTLSPPHQARCVSAPPQHVLPIGHQLQPPFLSPVVKIGLRHHQQMRQKILGQPVILLAMILRQHLMI